MSKGKELPTECRSERVLPDDMPENKEKSRRAMVRVVEILVALGREALEKEARAAQEQESPPPEEGNAPPVE